MRSPPSPLLYTSCCAKCMPYKVLHRTVPGSLGMGMHLSHSDGRATYSICPLIGKKWSSRYLPAITPLHSKSTALHISTCNEGHLQPLWHA